MPLTYDAPWLVALVDQRMALLKDHIPATLETDVIMTPLKEPPESANPADFDRYERTCDNCGTYCNDRTDFYTGMIERELMGLPVYMAFGVCGKCYTDE